MEDAQAILTQVPLIKTVGPNVDSGIQVIYGNRNWATRYRGVTPEYVRIRKWEMAAGNSFDQSSVEQNAAVCVLGKTVADSLFVDENPLGRIIRVREMPCS